ncbi:MAG: tyrosine-type recombinase/integrase [Beijerinckiaceae bacterium]|nr:tyrosine-type recombinase/integrase [Beijerinckiaceae bacterium]
MAGYVEKRRNGYYALTEVPPSLREAIGRKRFCKSLKTNDRAVANSRKWSVLAEFNAEIEAARSRVTGDAALDEARKLREELRKAPEKEAETLRDVIAMQAEELRGAPISDTAGIPPWEYEYDEKREEQAKAFHGLATGSATPLNEYLDQWLRETTYTARSQTDHRRAIRRLQDWGTKTLEEITRRKAGEFVSWLLMPHPEALWSGDRRSAAKLKSSLSRYWHWLKGKGLVDHNPWTEQTIHKPKANQVGYIEKARAFTDDEVLLLLEGSAKPIIADFIRIAALSGMRIDEICRLRVRDCENNLFYVSKAKTQAGVRYVPIHPDLHAILERRQKDKGPDEYLFNELKDPKAGSASERSMPVVKAFSRYLRKLKLEVLVGDKKRSLVTFHSLRRWFVTKAEQAGQPEAIIAAVVGHKRAGMTLGLYSAGPSADQFKVCVEAVKLPQPADRTNNWG